MAGFNTEKTSNKCVDWSKIGKRDYMDAMIQSPLNNNVLKKLLESSLTNKINDREMFMKGIDYSYYYEENE
jgi:cell filamentation protein